MSNKKKHHYVPIAYLKEFTDADGKVFVFRKDDTRKVLHQRPDNTGFRKYYYAQPLENGERNLNALEDQFGIFETKWKGFVDKAKVNEVGPKELEILIQFTILQHVRVPATRDAIELNLADQVKAAAAELDRQGKLPPPPKGYENLLSKANFAISPHKSIEAMSSFAIEFGRILSTLGLGILHNKTNIPFISSDNPVIWFDPIFKEHEILPYTPTVNGELFFVFPISKKMAIVGSTQNKAEFDKIGVLNGKTSSSKEIIKINRLVAKFSYEMFFASSKSNNVELLEEFADLSPTIVKPDSNLLQNQIQPSRVFSKRRVKARWQGR